MMIRRMLCQIFVWQSRHWRGETLVMVVVGGSAAAAP